MHRPSLPLPRGTTAVAVAGLSMTTVVALTAGPFQAPQPAAGLARPAAARWTPPPDTIVRITGTAADGFGIHLHDGSALFPPTRSEAIAECAEYDRAVARVRCATEVRTWYRDLAATRRAMRYARLQGRESAR